MKGFDFSSDINIRKKNPCFLLWPNYYKSGRKGQNFDAVIGKNDVGKVEPEIRISQALLNDVQHEIQMMRNVGLQFSVHETTGRTMVKVFYKETGKLIRQIPPEEFLNLADKMGGMIGIFFDKKV